MIPIADESPKGYIPFVNYILIAANVLVYFFLQMDTEGFYAAFGVVPSRLANSPENPLDYLSLFTSMFLHGSLMHLLGNMLYLWIFGDNIEYTIGHKRYLIFYLTAGLCASILQAVSDPQSSVPVIGASGAISGLLGAYLVKFPKNKISILFFLIIFIKVIKVPAVIVLAVWFLLQLSNAYIQMLDGGEGGVAWFAHIGGFAAGLILIKIFEKFPKL